MAQTKGIDISKWNGTFTKSKFEKLKQLGYSFVIIKAGGDNDGYYKDSQFENNYRCAKDAGLAVGCYYYLSRNFEPKSVTASLLSLLLGKTFEMPIYLDIEESVPEDREKTTANAIKVLNSLECLDYFVGVYASDAAGFGGMLDVKQLAPYSLWTAKWSDSKPTVVKNWGMWQNAVLKTGIPGFTINAVDVNICKDDYPNIIKGAHKNGF